MPAAAVIPAPIAYIKVVAVKKLVVGSRERSGGPAVLLTEVSLPRRRSHLTGSPRVLFAECPRRPECLL